MKIAVALLLCVVLPATFAMYAASLMDDLHKMESDCMKESGATMDEINMVRKNKAIPDTPKMNKWAMCMMMKHMVMMKDGSINMDPKTLKIPADMPDALMKAYEKCKSRTGKDMEHTAREMMNCFMQENMMMMAITMMKNSE